MFYSTFHSPRFQVWQTRMARMPRWGWIAVLVGGILPIVLLGISLLVVALLSGALVFAVVMLIALVKAVFRSLVRRHRDDGRRNVRIVVHSARVIDP